MESTYNLLPTLVNPSVEASVTDSTYTALFELLTEEASPRTISATSKNPPVAV